MFTTFFTDPFFSWIFFSTVYFFLTRSKTPSDINVCSEEVAEKCTWKSRFRRSSPINTLIKCSKRLQVANLQESTWNFFERHFYTQKNVLNTEPGISDDIAALWKSLAYIQIMEKWSIERKMLISPLVFHDIRLFFSYREKKVRYRRKLGVISAFFSL